MIYRLLRRALFCLDPEAAHELATEQMMRIEANPPLLRFVADWGNRGSEGPERRIWGLRFRNPVGIAAGFDKNALLVPFLRAIGFGFIEVGTVTPLPQPGNPRPRMFRLPGDLALINRLGFNNDGAEAVGRRLESLWNSVERRGTSVEQRVPLFVNIGKNRDVPVARAAADYRRAYQRLARWADGVVVNVSSPNTPGLRLLQGAEELRGILSEIGEEKARTAFATGGSHPVLVKLAPDLADADLEASVDVAASLADGMIATNTTLAREDLQSGVSEIGGLSGKPLFSRSTETLRKIRVHVGRDFPLIGVGGVFSAADARAKIEAGADLVQLYTGFIYEGPSVARRIARGLQ
jgi:dihydroorotate dehydrogenase